MLTLITERLCGDRRHATILDGSAQGLYAWTELDVCKGHKSVYNRSEGMRRMAYPVSTLNETRGYLDTHPWITFELDISRAPVRFWTLLGDACSKCEVISGIPLMPETAKKLNLVSLQRGALATTAIEGNTLSEEEVAKLVRGELHLPPSKEYLGIEVSNILGVFNEMIGPIQTLPLNAERIKYLNDRILQGLELEDGVVPGELRVHEVGVARYKGAPARDCEYLLSRLCEWLDSMNFQLGHSKLALAVLKAIVAHLYLLWIHPFGDGNGRVARLVEYQILLSAGVPNPATHLMSNHYNQTRSEYYRRLDRASREQSGVIDFLVYALQGFVDGLTEQFETIKDQIKKDMWTSYVHTEFRDRPGRADIRRRHLVLDLAEQDEPVRRRDIRLLTPRLAEAYSGKTDKTITRDLNTLSRLGLIAKTRHFAWADKEIMRAFLD